MTGSGGAERSTDRHRMCVETTCDRPEREAGRHQRPNLGDVHVVATGAPKPPTLGLRSAEPGHHAIPDEIPLELGDGRC